jgi:hypothetical protein
MDCGWHDGIASREAGGECVQAFGRVGAGVGAEQDRRLARVDLERLRAGGVLLAGGVEVADRGAVVRAVDPAVGRTELELRGWARLIASSVPAGRCRRRCDRLLSCSFVSFVLVVGPVPDRLMTGPPSQLEGG